MAVLHSKQSAAVSEEWRTSRPGDDRGPTAQVEQPTETWGLVRSPGGSGKASRLELVRLKGGKRRKQPTCAVQSHCDPWALLLCQITVYPSST
jgi:hypothetical protein